jgi:hypothetical protein
MAVINLTAKALSVYVGLASFMCSLADLTSPVSRQYFSIRIGLMTHITTISSYAHIQPVDAFITITARG